MGQHKYNQTAIMAKDGELPPKEKPMSKRKKERLLYAKCKDVLCQPFSYDASIEEYYK